MGAIDASTALTWVEPEYVKSQDIVKQALKVRGSVGTQRTEPPSSTRDPWAPWEPVALQFFASRDTEVPIMAITQNAGKEGSVIVEYLLKILGLNLVG